MVIGERIREVREQKNLSQGDIEKRTGLLRCYISRVENGHTVSAVETLEKMARALDLPLYQLFYEGENPPKLIKLKSKGMNERIDWGGSGKDADQLARFRRLLSRMDDRSRRLLLHMAQKMATKAAESD